MRKTPHPSPEGEEGKEAPECSLLEPGPRQERQGVFTWHGHLAFIWPEERKAF